MMKKIFLKLSMLLFVLSMGTNAAWADMQGMIEQMMETNPEMAQHLIDVLGAQTYCAQLTGHASSTGGGKVYVNTSSTDPRTAEYEEGTSNVAVNGMGMSMSGMTKIGIKAWAKPEDGYWLAGFSSSNMGIDLGRGNNDMYEGLYEVGVHENETIEHVIYATFEPIRIASYEISGTTTTSDDGAGNKICDLTVIFTLSGAEEDIDAGDFKNPVVSGDGWSLTDWDYNTSNAGKVTVNVHFTTSNTNPADYSGTAVLETKAGVKMTANLNARTPSASSKDFSLYNGKTPINDYDFSDLAGLNLSGYANPIIKLNSGYNSAITINKSLTLDLNGYDIMVLNGTAITVTSNATLTLAYSPYNDTDHGRIIGMNNQCISVETGSKLILNGGTIFNANNAIAVASGAELKQNGANIFGANNAIYSEGTVTTIDGNIKGRVRSLGSNAELIINGGTIDNISETINDVSFATGIAVQIDGGTAQIKKGNIVGQTFGVQSAGSTTIEKLAYIRGTDNQALSVTGGITTVQCGKFVDPDLLSEVTGGVLDFQSAYFKANSTAMTAVAGKPLWRNTSGSEFREDYLFFAGTETAAKEAGVSMCHIGAVSYSSLEDALAYANNTSASEKVLIIMDNDYALPAGYYTLPSNATLLIPKSNDQAAVSSVVARESSYTRPSLFRKLTLLDGVNLDVFGTIEVGGTQFSALNTKTGSVTGPYAMLQMNAGSKITLQNNSHLYAWGYVAGDVANKDAQHHVPAGEIDARRGATVYEMFQMGDWGNTMMNAIGLVTNDTRFPINAYFVQNVEVPTKYHAGARLTTATSVSADLSGAHIMMCANDIQVIGVTNVDVAVFLMDQEADAENTWVRKWYDASKDQQVYEINSAAHIGSLVINLASSPLLNNLEQTLVSGAFGEQMQGIGQAASEMGAHFTQDLVMNSGQYVLPITYNFKLHLLSGTLDFTQNTALIPSSELEIDKEAKVYVTDQDTEGVLEGFLYIYDSEDWSNEAKKVAYSPSFDDGANNGSVPSSVRNVSSLEDAKVNVHGTFDTYQGYIFTSESGGNIFSSVEDAGTFMFTSAAKAAAYYEEVKVTTSETKRFYSAYLKNSPEWIANGGDEYAQTGSTEANTSYCYLDIDGNGGHWTLLEQDGCFVHDALNDIYYIKPQEYVALANGKTENADHTYSDAAGDGRLFILMTDEFGLDCQWWEVEAKENYFHCIHPENDTYYEWDEDHNEWKEKKFTITWKDWDGSLISTYSVSYGTQAEWLSTNPTRPANKDYTYDFTGWSPALGRVTGDVTYTATYEEKQIKYTVVFVQDGGVEIERHLLARDEVPVCENVPTRTGYILQWEPGIEPVVGNQTYTATWLPEPPATYTITFKNYDGTQLDQQQVTAGEKPEYAGATPITKPATSEYEYAFTGWKPALAPATTNATYVAQYSKNARTYAIKFYDENGSGELKSESLEWGATPTPPAVSKSKTGYTYTYVWQNMADASKTIESVKGAANYKPVFTETPNKYTVTMQCNVDGACTFTGAGIYDFNTSVTPTATIKDPTAYEFVEWTGTSHSFGTRQVTGDITLSVMVKEKDAELEDLEVGNGTRDIASAAEYMNLVINSNGLDASGQLTGADNITLYGNADFVLQQTIEAGKWYSIAVPWRVNANGGVYLGDATTPATLGPDFEVIYYDGSVRATQGPGAHCWVYMKNLGSSQKVLEPGRAYMIYLKKNSVSKITFRKTAKANLLTTSTSVQEYPETTNNDGKDANWNAIANPALYHAYINAGNTDHRAQHYLADEERYDWFYMNLPKNILVVGEPIYVQAGTSNSVVANGASYAPRRAKTEQTTYDVNITAAGAAKYADHLSIQINDDKEADKYTIGQDLLKFGVSSKAAQMWINRYDAKLCVNTMVSGEESTFFPMSIYAPKAGDYTIAIEREVATEDYALYLTYNGEAIWNLSEGAYVANLYQGTDANYGLRISAKAPQNTTGIDEAVVDAKGDTRKVLIDNQVYIIRGDKVYSIDGQLVK